MLPRELSCITLIVSSNRTRKIVENWPSNLNAESAKISPIPGGRVNFLCAGAKQFTQTR
jgi:hypothetical protein